MIHESDGMQEEIMKSSVAQRLHITPTSLLRGEPILPSSKYFTLRYVLAAALARGESTVFLPALSDDSEALFRGCRALGAALKWKDEQCSTLNVQGIGRPERAEAVTINVGNAGAVLRLLLGVGAFLADVTFETDHPQSLGKRPNRELLEALTTIGVVCEGSGKEGYLPITLHGGRLHGGRVKVSGQRSSQYLSSLLFMAPLLNEPMDIEVVDELKSQALIHVTLNVLQEAGVSITHDEALRHFSIAAGQSYQPRDYIVPGDYPAAAAILAACAVTTDPGSEIYLARLRQDDEVGIALVDALQAMGADIRIEGETVRLRGGRRLQSIEMDGDKAIDCIPVLVAAACFAEGESVFYNVESLHYKESDRIVDLCTELRKAGCMVIPQHDAIVVRGQPQGVEGGVEVNGHSDHRLLMALAIVALRSKRGLTLRGTEHIAKSYPSFFEDLRKLGVEIRSINPR